MVQAADLMQVLAQHPIFAVLSPEERDSVAGQAVHKTYARDEIITYNGDVWPYLLLIESGLLHGLKESIEGRRLIVITLEPGDLLWGMAFFEEDAAMPVMLQAQVESNAWLWHRDWLRPILWNNGRFSWEFSRFAVSRMQRASAIVEELAFQPVRSRLARLLLDHYGDADNRYVARDMTLDEMAAYVGTKRELVCRLLYQFAAEGVIEISRTEYKVADHARLEEHARQAKS